jgi:hypothetical protein
LRVLEKERSLGGTTLHDSNDATKNVPATSDAAISEYATTSNATIPAEYAKPNASNGASC